VLLTYEQDVGVATVGVANVLVFNMDEAGLGRRGLPKFSEILRRPRGEAEVND